MKFTLIIVRFSTIALLAAGVLTTAIRLDAYGAPLRLGDRSFDELVQEAKRTGVVQRALRGILLLRTVKGTLQLERKDGRVVGAVIEAEAVEDYAFLKDENYRCAIAARRWKPERATYSIPETAAHFFLIRPDMESRTVEAQFQLAVPSRNDVEDLRFIEVYRDQDHRVSLPEGTPHSAPRISAGDRYYVAPNGDDGAPGTADKPFQTIRRGMSALKPGDTLALREGRYHEAISASGLNGAVDRPITIQSVEGERATIDGSEDLDAVAAGPWAIHDEKAGIWKRPLKEVSLQLWRDGKMLMVARWPKISKYWTDDMDPRFNGRIPEPGTAWNIDSYFARFATAKARANFADSTLTSLLDPNCAFAENEFGSVPHARLLAFESIGELGRTGRSFSGAVVEGLNDGWALVTSHEPGSDRIEVAFDDFSDGFTPTVGEGRFALVNHLNCLDQTNEWVFDSMTRTVYVRLAPGDAPAGHTFRVKSADMVSRLDGCANVHIRGIDFFACAFEAAQSPGTVVESCIFSYPTCKSPTLVALKMREAAATRVAPTRQGASEQPAKKATKAAARHARKQAESQATDGTPEPKAETVAAAPEEDTTGTDGFIPCAVSISPGGVLRDCEIRFYDGIGVEMEGPDSVVENCHLHHGTRYAVVFTRSPGAIARRNTIHSTLTEGAIRIRKTPEGRFTSELNYGYDFGCWRSDASGTQVQSGSQMFHMFRNNWFHHSECKAARFDGQPAGSLGTFVDNVGWELWQGLQVKGDYQKVFNNTFFSCGARLDISIVNQMAFGGAQHSIMRNNLCDRISGSRMSEDLNGDGVIPGCHDHNWNGLVTNRKSKTLLRDPDNFDFRPVASREVIDAGSELVDDRFVEGGWLDNLRFARAEEDSTKRFIQEDVSVDGGPKNLHVRPYLGQSPDLGAYEYGDKHYWIAGRQVAKASFPIPPDGARFVKTDADLMWLEGKSAVSHNVYFGADRDRVARADTTSPEYMGNFTDSNICTPRGGLQKGTCYYWRVDAVEIDGGVRRGDVWSFLPCDGQYEEYRRIPTPANLSVEAANDGNVVVRWDAVTDERLAGYNVYRRWGNPEYATTAGERRNITPLTGTTFTDGGFDRPGKWYYVVEGVDKEGVNSYESTAVEIMIDAIGKSRE
jgi:hypothetical protein